MTIGHETETLTVDVIPHAAYISSARPKANTYGEGRTIREGCQRRA